jgi:succinate-acetate transporter protein
MKTSLYCIMALPVAFALLLKCFDIDNLEVTRTGGVCVCMCVCVCIYIYIYIYITLFNKN